MIYLSPAMSALPSKQHCCQAGYFAKEKQLNM